MHVETTWSRGRLTMQVLLDLFVITPKKGAFKVKGASTVCVSGYYEPGPEVQSDEGSEDDDTEMEQEEKATMAAGATVAAGDEGSSDQHLSDDGESQPEEAPTQKTQQACAGSPKKSFIPTTPSKQLKTVNVPKPKPVQPEAILVAQATEPTNNKRKAPAYPAQRREEQAKKPHKSKTAANAAAAASFEKTVGDYPKKHGRCPISQVASTCRKAAAITSKYKEFLSSCAVFAIDGQYVSLKA